MSADQDVSLFIHTEFAVLTNVFCDQSFDRYVFISAFHSSRSVMPRAFSSSFFVAPFAPTSSMDSALEML